MNQSTIDTRTLFALCKEWLLIFSIMAICIYLQSTIVWLIGAVLLATRQHALLALYHDAVHGLLAKNRQLNDFLINVFVGIPVLMPVELFRPLHLQHHRDLGQESDPERTILFAEQHWNYHPLTLLKLIRQLMADLFLLNAIRTIRAWNKANGSIPINRLIFLAAAIWIVVLGVLAFFLTATTIKAVVFWTLTAFTLTNLLQKLRSYAEHGGPTNHTNAEHSWTYSWQAGWLGRLMIWPYHINHHREHHSSPRLPWYSLPARADNSSGVVKGKWLLPLLLRSPVDYRQT